jgi:hypothetical protein
MADYYTQASEVYPLEADQVATAKQVVKDFEDAVESGEFSEDKDFVDFAWEFIKEGLWIHEDESLDLDQVEALIKRLQEALNDEKHFVMSWAGTCSKPRIGEFGGGAFAVKKGHPTYWVDARVSAEAHFRDR